jgi:imidazoleglycerol-phosphate dehydratase
MNRDERMAAGGAGQASEPRDGAGQASEPRDGAGRGSQPGDGGAPPGRRAVRARKTRETDVRIELALDGSGIANVHTGIGFYDHLLSSLAHHALIDLSIEAGGDLDVDEHHTVEDVAITLGEAFAEALVDRARITRFGEASVPMDEALATAVIDLSGRSYAVLDLVFRGERVGALSTQLIEHALEAFARTAGVTLHLRASGRNDHHVAEAAFKALARALRAAVAIDERRLGVASTKGVLG